MTTQLVHIAVPVPLRKTFCYTHSAQLDVGVRVLVSFANRQLVGVVVPSNGDEPADTVKLKPVLSVLDSEPVLSSAMLDICHWLSRYYHHPIGEVVHTVLPVILRKGEPVPEPVKTFLQLTEAGRQQLTDQPNMRAKKQHTCLTMLADGDIELAELKQDFSDAILRALKKQQWVVQVDVPIAQQGRWLENVSLGPKPVPSPEQAVAIAAIGASQHQFACFLLEGVTGSGKTEVYLQSIEPLLLQGKQVLILVPEIGLTPQTVSRFEKRFGVEVGVLHSQITDKERAVIWQRARQGDIPLVIGTRSAIFTPMANLGMIIVDEEHDDSFKQQDGLRYHARDLAVMLARQQQIPILLGSATPSLESLNNGLSKRYALLTLSRRAGGAHNVTQQVVDVRNQQLSFGLSDSVLSQMQQHFARGDQVLVFLNRRGYAPALICHQCGHTHMCRRCERPYTLHQSPRKLHCHHCGHTQKVPTHCSECGSAELVSEGIGTEQLEEGLASLFPTVKQVRIDSDSVRGKNKLQNTLTAINQREFQLLIGTQILSKGHHFPHVTLVVVMDCDGALFSGDFRASEKLAQLVTQLAGRAGREEKRGEMLLQTHNPDHPLLMDLALNGYGHFARQAILERKYANLPPFSSQCIIRAESMYRDLAHDFLAQVRQYLPQSDINVIGPVPSLIEKRQGRFRFMLVLQSRDRKKLHTQVHTALAIIQDNPLAAKVRWSLDVDPMDFS